MAKNLISKIEPSDTLAIYDRDTEVTTKFLKEVDLAASNATAGEKAVKVKVGSSPREVAEQSVCTRTGYRHLP